MRAERLLCSFWDEELSRLNDERNTIIAHALVEETDIKVLRGRIHKINKRLDHADEMRGKCDLNETEVNHLETLYRNIVLSSMNHPRMITVVKEWTDKTGRKHKRVRRDEAGNPIRRKWSPTREVSAEDYNYVLTMSTISGRWNIQEKDDFEDDGMLTLTHRQIATSLSLHELRKLVHALPTDRTHFDENSERDILANEILHRTFITFTEEYEHKHFRDKGYYPAISYIDEDGKVKTRVPTVDDFVRRASDIYDIMGDEDMAPVEEAALEMATRTIIERPIAKVPKNERNERIGRIREWLGEAKLRRKRLRDIAVDKVDDEEKVDREGTTE
tara:strand:- start:2851 stop:3843 length:993 start_codon:yes stop_codon:yes gene_type:complete